MKRMFFILFLFFSFSVFPEDLKTKSGETYKDYTVHGVSKQGISITHSYGGCIIPFEELPDKLKEEYLLELKNKERASAKQQSSKSKGISQNVTPPITGSIGNRQQESETNYSSTTFSTSSGRVIHTGPRDGRYYINKNGNKTYIRKKKN